MSIKTKVSSGEWKGNWKSWEEVLEDGWKFICPDFQTRIIVMTRNGYINEFREF